MRCRGASLRGGGSARGAVAAAVGVHARQEVGGSWHGPSPAAARLDEGVSLGVAGGHRDARRGRHRRLRRPVAMVMAAQVVVVGARVGADLRLVAMVMVGVPRVEEGGGGGGGGGAGGGEDLDAPLAGGAHLLDVFEELLQGRLPLLPTSPWPRAPPLLGGGARRSRWSGGCHGDGGWRAAVGRDEEAELWGRGPPPL